MTILEDLWLGNIRLQDRDLRCDCDYRMAMRKVGEEKKRLLANQPIEVEALAERLLDVQTEMEVIAERDAFVLGFRLAVQLMVESLKKD